MKSTVRKTLEAIKEAGLISEFTMGRVKAEGSRPAFTSVKARGILSVSEETYWCKGESDLTCYFDTGDVGVELRKLCDRMGWTYSARCDDENGRIRINCKRIKGNHWWE